MVSDGLSRNTGQNFDSEEVLTGWDQWWHVVAVVVVVVADDGPSEAAPFRWLLPASAEEESEAEMDRGRQEALAAWALEPGQRVTQMFMDLAVGST